MVTVYENIYNIYNLYMGEVLTGQEKVIQKDCDRDEASNGDSDDTKPYYVDCGDEDEISLYLN